MLVAAKDLLIREACRGKRIPVPDTGFIRKYTILTDGIVNGTESGSGSDCWKIAEECLGNIMELDDSHAGSFTDAYGRYLEAMQAIRDYTEEMNEAVERQRRMQDDGIPYADDGFCFEDVEEECTEGVESAKKDADSAAREMERIMEDAKKMTVR